MTREQRVRTFMSLMGQKIGGEWSYHDLEMQMGLLEEEFEEMFDVLYTIKACLDNKTWIDTELKAELLGEMADLQVVLSGLAVMLDLPLKEAFREKMQANMTKLGDDGKPIRREDGKILKGPNYVPPDMLKVIKKAGNG